MLFPLSLWNHLWYTTLLKSSIINQHRKEVISNFMPNNIRHILHDHLSLCCIFHNIILDLMKADFTTISCISCNILMMLLWQLKRPIINNLDNKSPSTRNLFIPFFHASEIASRSDTPFLPFQKDLTWRKKRCAQIIHDDKTNNLQLCLFKKQFLISKLSSCTLFYVTQYTSIRC